MRTRPGRSGAAEDTYEGSEAARPSPGKRSRSESRYGGEGATGAANGTEQQTTAGVGATALPFLPVEVLSRLEASFGALPEFEIVIDQARVPDGARAASDERRIYLRDEADTEDLALVAHEVAHVAQIARSARVAGGAHKVDHTAADIPADAREGADETGRERRSLEEEADRAAADVEAGNRVAALSSTPVTEGETYLQVSPGRVAAKSVRLVLFPGEQQRADGTTVGHLYVYVKGELKKSYEAVGGPAPGAGYADGGGHSAGVTPAGGYVLDREEHHTTRNWPMSVIPWGAKLREKGGEIEYSSDGRTWLKATGLDGGVTKASILFEERTRASAAAEQNRAHAGDRSWKRVSPAPLTATEKKEINDATRTIFYDSSGTLLSSWEGNDFGNWAFNMKREGERSAYYVHTTPDDEKTTAAGATPTLAQSHGCVHIRPADRAEMMNLGYLQAGVVMTVKKYGLVGP